MGAGSSSNPATGPSADPPADSPPEGSADPTEDQTEAPATPTTSTPGHKAFRVMTYNVRGPLDTGAWAWPERRAAVIQRILQTYDKNDKG